MYYVRKYADCWAIHNDDNGRSRPLTEAEKELFIKEFPEIKQENVRTIFSDNIYSIKEKP